MKIDGMAKCEAVNCAHSRVIVQTPFKLLGQQTRSLLAGNLQPFTDT